MTPKPNPTKKLIQVAAISLAIVIAFLYYFSQQSETDLESYTQMITQKRAETDEFMRTSEASPFQDSLLEAYKG